MADSSKVVRIADLNLSAEQKQQVFEAASAAVAVSVYRELQRAKQTAAAADSGCQIIGNCSCSSKSLE
jgi:hypothetical protein